MDTDLCRALREVWLTRKAPRQRRSEPDELMGSMELTNALGRRARSQGRHVWNACNAIL